MASAAKQMAYCILGLRAYAATTMPRRDAAAPHVFHVTPLRSSISYLINLIRSTALALSVLHHRLSLIYSG